jgi:hypothetical protein
VVAYHPQPLHLLVVELVAGAAVALEDPALEVALDGLGVGGELGV